MSLHSDSDSDSSFGFMVLLPSEFAIPVLLILVLILIGTCVYENENEPEWRASAERAVVTWTRKAHAADDVKLLQCRREAGAVFHCDLSIAAIPKGPRQVVTVDCDGAKPGQCEACSE